MASPFGADGWKIRLKDRKRGNHLNQTSNYQLNQWEPTDRILMQDFNSDNSKIDGALAAHDSEISALEAQNTALQTAMAAKGNCKLEYQTYTGNGASARAFTFSGKPRLICIVGSENYFLLAAQGIPRSVCYGGGGDEASSAVWSGNSVTLSNSNNREHFICNNQDSSYGIVAFVDAED